MTFDHDDDQAPEIQDDIETHEPGYEPADEETIEQPGAYDYDDQGLEIEGHPTPDEQPEPSQDDPEANDGEPVARVPGLSATYDPGDNKLRLYSVAKFDDATYNRVKAAGFRWAPRQKLWVAPAWSPDREDLLLELCGEIGDEDTSLVDRAEERAERFEDYSANRLRDAERAKSSVDAIADGIPFGQPLLIGHHSEKRARKDRERIENGVRKAVNLWKTSTYWQQRADGALHHAKYKEIPAVRYRRIKGIESDKRKQEQRKADAEKRIKHWSREDLDHAKALQIANVCNHGSYCFPLDKFPRAEPASQYEGYMSLWSALTDGVITHEQAAAFAIPSARSMVAWCNRWIEHYDNRLAYERAMLQEAGGIKADGYDLQIGGQVTYRGYADWLTITRLNKKDGAILSVSVANNKFPTVVSVEKIGGYRPPTEEQTATVKAATKLPPMCNYPEASIVVKPHTVNPQDITRRAVEMTKAEWDRLWKDVKTSCVIPGTDDYGTHRVRSHWTRGNHQPVYLTDEKRKDPPKPDAAPRPKLPPVEKDLPTLQAQAERSQAFRAELAAEEASPFAALAEVAKNGVQVVAVPQLFPTPRELARRVVELAEIEPRHRILEPSAGTGRLIEAIQDECSSDDTPQIVAVEINPALAEHLGKIRQFGYESRYDIRQADFLACNGNLGTFDRIVMNPPFANAEDIKHVEHALRFLRPCGRLVAIVANGPRQQAKLKPLADEWIDLPPDSFKDSGTSINAAIAVFTA